MCTAQTHVYFLGRKRTFTRSLGQKIRDRDPVQYALRRLKWIFFVAVVALALMCQLRASEGATAPTTALSMEHWGRHERATKQQTDYFDSLVGR